MPYEKVLFIDDDEDDLYFFKNAATSVSPDTVVITLSDPRDALQKLEGGTIAPDLIILDLNMPLMSGQQFLAELQHRLIPLDIPIVVISSIDLPGTAEEVRALGASDYFAKPDNLPRIKTLLRQLLQ